MIICLRGYHWDLTKRPFRELVLSHSAYRECGLDVIDAEVWEKLWDMVVPGSVRHLNQDDWQQMHDLVIKMFSEQ